MQINRENITKSFRAIAGQETILKFLRLMSRNPWISALNDYLLFTQDENAGIVCGAAAWKHSGREIRENVSHILVAPVLVNEGGKDTVEFDPVNVIEEYYTDGEDIPLPSPERIPDAVARVTGYTLELVPEGKLSRIKKLAGCDIDSAAEVIRVSNSLSEQKIYSAILGAYIWYYLDMVKIHDSLVGVAVRYLLCEYYRLETAGIKGVLFAGLTELEDEDIYSFFEVVQRCSFNIIQMLTEPLLSFDETAVTNQLLKSGDPEAFLNALYKAKEDTAGDSFAGYVIEGLINKVREDSEIIDKLYQQKTKDGCLYSYPPTKINGGERRDA